MTDTRRPRRDTVQRRTAPPLRVTLTDQESEAIFNAAQHANLRMADWARRILLAAARESENDT